MYCTIERMDGCKYSIETIMVPLKERTTRANCFFLNDHIAAERIAQTMNDCKFSCQNKYSTLQGIDDCHSFL